RRRGGEACCVKYFVIAPESGSKRRAMARRVKMDAAQGGKGEARECVFSRVTFCCFPAWPYSSPAWGLWLRACSSADCRGSAGWGRGARAAKTATGAPLPAFAVGHSRGYSDVGAIGGLVTLDIPPAGASRRSRPRRRAARAAPPFRVGHAGARSRAHWRCCAGVIRKEPG